MIEIPAATIVLAHTTPRWVQTFGDIYNIMQPFLWPTMLMILGWGISILKQHGYQTTYALALVRALGKGVVAAQDAGLDPFKAEGRALVIKSGTEYLQNTVADAAAKLGINTAEDHAARITAQMGTVLADAQASAQATMMEVTSATVRHTTGG